MRVTLPEALLLFAVHDNKGTVHSAAYLALDPGLRGAVLAELKLRGLVQVRASGDARWAPGHGPMALPDPNATPTVPFLVAACKALAEVPSPGPVMAWLGALRRGLPDLRAQVRATLVHRGVLANASATTGLIAYKIANTVAERALKSAVSGALDDGDAVSARHGLLIGLSTACHLTTPVFGARGPEAEDRTIWVSERDAVLRAVFETIAETEGQG